MKSAYAVNRPLMATEFVDELRRSTHDSHRPVAYVPCIQGMLDHANLGVTTYADDLLVGVARSVNDFNLWCQYRSSRCSPIARRAFKRGTRSANVWSAFSIKKSFTFPARFNSAIFAFAWTIKRL